MSEQSSRPVVSMPSLDAVDDDDIAASGETSGATLSEASLTLGGGLTTEASFTSSISTDGTYSINSEVAASESFSSVTETFTTNTETYVATSGVLPPEESFTSSDTPSVDPNQLLESSEIEQTTEEETKESDGENQVIPEESVAILHQEEPVDEQTEDDPSIAIDQFIKKIADEQLSSKRRELNNEEDHSETQEISQIVESTQGDSSLEATLTGNDPDDSVNQSDEVQITHVPASEQNSMGDEELTHHVDTTLEKLLEASAEQKTNEVVESEVMETDVSAVEFQEQLPELTEKDPVIEDVPKMKKRETLPDILLDSSEVSRDPFLIALAQEELKKLDILVCGGCHLTFYVLEEFQEHKNGQCTDVSTIKNFCENEGKPQVWGFSLWRARYLKECGDSPPRPWLVYQKWCKLPQQEKNAWITAGQSVQYMSKIGNAKVACNKKRQPVEKELLPLEFVDSNKENSDVYENTTNITKKTIVTPVKLNNDVTILPSNKTNSEPNTNKAVRTTKNSSAQKEFAVERILAKRFNPRRKTWEYQIKWESFDNESNTWEPISNLSHCKQMLEQFEEQLKRVKEEKAKQAALAGKGRGRPSKPSPLPISGDFTPGRPQRSSKQKATNQIRSWVGGISDDEESQGTKRQREDDDDYDNDADYEVFEKKIKLEEESDDSDDERKAKPTPIKKVASTPARSAAQKFQSVNIKSSIVGQKGKQEILPSNILIPDANGVVRINQKQLPALSSGVYIMSKTAGIIKLDSTTSKVATSGGQTIVKVAPKIGQTQIKIVKKDGNTTRQIIQVQSPQKPNIPLRPMISSINKTNPLKTYPSNKIIPKQKQVPKIVRPKLAPPSRIEITKPQTSAQEEESDDGLEPLEFPDEIVVPDPEPENAEFDLDPETGKIKGLEYVDKPVIIKEEPGTRPPTTNELENIVTLAAADITDDDLTNGDTSQDEQDPLDISSTNNKFRRMSSSGSNQGYKQYITKSSVGQVRKPEGSLLNKALTGNNSFQKTASSGGTPQQRAQPKIVTQRVINQQVTQRSAGGLTTRIVTQSRPGQQQSPMVRKVVTPAPRPKFSVASQQQRTAPPGSTVTRIMPQQASAFQMRGTSPTKMQVYSTKSQSTTAGNPQIVRRVGYATSRSSTTPQIVQRTPQKTFSSQKQPQTRIVQRYYTSPVKKETPQIVSRAAKPSQIISMPSLIGEDDLPAAPKLAAKPQISQSSRSPTKSFSEDLKTTPVVSEEQREEETSSDNVTTADLSTFTMADSENPIYITGDDGTVYQVAGQNEQGQTILITQGPDGQQQCLLVTNEVAEGAAEEGISVAQAAEDEAAAEAEQSTVSEDSMTIPLINDAVTSEASSDIQMPLQIKTDMDIEESALEEGAQDQVVAQVVRAEPPSPGGTHKVVVMLPDGNLMVTQVSPEEYASLELD